MPTSDRPNNLSFEGSGRISVNVDELVKSPRVQAQVKAVTKIFNELIGTDRGSEFFEKATMTDHTPTPRTDALHAALMRPFQATVPGMPDYMKAMRQHAEELERELAEAKRAWIPVSERLPKIGLVVLVWYGNDSAATGFVTGEGGEWSAWGESESGRDESICYIRRPIGWMPLPEAPK